MNDYKGADNIYWLFSTSAQAIAAFVGLLAAGYFFSHEKLERSRIEDETLTEILDEIFKSNHQRLQFLFVLTGFAIFTSIVVIFLNGFDIADFNLLLQTIVAILNIITIYQAINFAIYITKPDKIKSTAKKLINEDKENFDDVEIQTVSIGKFVEEFILLEQLIRNLYWKSSNRSPSRQWLPVREMFNELTDEKTISRDYYDSFIKLNKIRNLAVHGELKTIEAHHLADIKTLINYLNSLNK